MKTKALSQIITAVLIAIATISTAQIQPDTISLNKRRPFFEYKGEKINKPAKLRHILLQEPVDPKVQTYWSQYKTSHGVALGIEIAGVGLMGYSLIQSAGGKESSGGTMIAGAGLLLTGVIIDLAVAKARAKSAVKRYNDVKLGRD